MRLLLDTNAYSALGRGDRAVATLIRASQELVFSSVVAGELLAGFRLGRRSQQNLEELRRFLAEPHVAFVEVGWRTAEVYGGVFSSLRAEGTPIPSNDLWIAAHAIERDASLVSFDGHFRHVSNLTWIDPNQPA